MIVTVIWTDHFHDHVMMEEIIINEAAVPDPKTMVTMAMEKKGYTGAELHSAIGLDYELIGIAIGTITWLE